MSQTAQERHSRSDGVGLTGEPVQHAPAPAAATGPKTAQARRPVALSDRVSASIKSDASSGYDSDQMDDGDGLDSSVQDAEQAMVRCLELFGCSPRGAARVTLFFGRASSAFAHYSVYQRFQLYVESFLDFDSTHQDLLRVLETVLELPSATSSRYCQIFRSTFEGHYSASQFLMSVFGETARSATLVAGESRRSGPGDKKPAWSVRAAQDSWSWQSLPDTYTHPEVAVVRIPVWKRGNYLFAASDSELPMWARLSRAKDQAGARPALWNSWFHGTTVSSADNILRTGIQPFGLPNTDFSVTPAFYIGDNFPKAAQWAIGRHEISSDKDLPVVLVFGDIVQPNQDNADNQTFFEWAQEHTKPVKVFPAATSTTTNKTEPWYQWTRYCRDPTSTTTDKVLIREINRAAIVKGPVVREFKKWDKIDKMQQIAVRDLDAMEELQHRLVGVVILDIQMQDSGDDAEQDDETSSGYVSSSSSSSSSAVGSATLTPKPVPVTAPAQSSLAAGTPSKISATPATTPQRTPQVLSWSQRVAKSSTQPGK